MFTSSEIRGFANRDDGSIAALWALFLIVVFGFLAIAYDLGRVVNTHGELQSYADQAALAAAGELDGAGDARKRACLAAANLATGLQVFASGSRDLSGSTEAAVKCATSANVYDFGEFKLTLLSAIRGTDSNTAASDTTASNDSNAIYAKVNVTPHALSLDYLRAATTLVGGGNALIQANLTAEAVAGFTQDACDVTPMMFCLPPPSGADTDGFYAADNHIGALIRLRTGGNSAAWGPGDFGFLDTDAFTDPASVCYGLKGTSAMLQCLLGAEGKLTKCYNTRGVNTEPGQKKGITNNALNTRFDIYDGSINKARTDVNFRPAANVLKGQTTTVNGNNCKYDDNTTNADPAQSTQPMPVDDCYNGASPTCTRYGDANWSAGKTAYLNQNFTSAQQSTLAAMTVTSTFKNIGGTRFEQYLKEVSLGDNPTAGGPIVTKSTAEDGRKQCSSQAASPDPMRRVIAIAGIDCTANPVNGSSVGVPVKEYFAMFLTRPVSEYEAETKTVGQKFDIWGEIIGSLGRSGYTSAGEGGVFRDIVQLYR